MIAPDPAVVRELEETSFRSWPALSSERLGGWLLRYSEGYTKRANSVNVLEPDTGDLEARIGEAERSYRSRALEPTFRLTPLAEPGLDAVLATRGYAIVDPSLVMAAPMDGRAERHPGVTIVAGDDTAWRLAQAVAAGLSEARADIQRRMLALVPGRMVLAACVGPQGPTAFGIAVVDRGRVGFFDVLTVPGARRQGHGRRLMESLIAWARDDTGATDMWIQVVAANAPARTLYESLGFGIVYPYHYRIAR